MSGCCFDVAEEEEEEEEEGLYRLRPRARS